MHVRTKYRLASKSKLKVSIGGRRSSCKGVQFTFFEAVQMHVCHYGNCGVMLARSTLRSKAFVVKSKEEALLIGFNCRRAIQEQNSTCICGLMRLK